MLQWFKDDLLTLPIIPSAPKWVCIPLSGGQFQTTVWLGDAYTSTISTALTSVATSISVLQIDEFPETGVIQIDQEQIAYTGISATPPTITGCTRGYNSTTAAAHLVGAIVYPQITYSSVSGHISIVVSGMLQGPTSLSLSSSTIFGPPGVQLLLPITSISSGIAGAVPINLQITMPAGSEQYYTNLGVSLTPVSRPGDSQNDYEVFIVQPIGDLFVQQRNQGLQNRLRLLPLNRKVNTNLPGFDWGQYRWRNNTTENAQAVVPTRWDIDTSAIQQDFIAGVGSIGETNDLEPILLEQDESSIFLRINRGQYFTGTKRYYLPSDNFNLEFLPCYPGLPFTYQLLQPPREQTPVFVGNWFLDSQAFYEYRLNARYTIESTFEPNSTQPQFIVDRKTGILTVNAATQIEQTTYIIGILTGGLIEYFNLPVYPVDSIANVYAGTPGGVGVAISNFTFSREAGYITFPKVPGTQQGQVLFATVNAAIAILYEYDIDSSVEMQNTNIPDEEDLLENTRLTTADLNPAFSGLSSGYVYLQQREIVPVSVTLSADKPQIPIPPTLSSIIGLIAYGPVYYNGDYALLTATAIGSLANELVPGAQLQVIPGGLNPDTGLPLQNYPFRGLINGLDPNTDTIIVTTGGDGIANMVFQPEPNFGFYIPTLSPWAVPSATYTPTSSTWVGGVATITFTTPITHEFVIGTTVRLAGFNPSAWDGDYAITGVNQTAGTITISITNNPGAIVSEGTVGPVDTLLLPNPIPISQIWSGPPTNEGWLEFVYAVLSNNPLFGLTDGNPTQGQIPFATNGTVNGDITITNAAWTGDIATYTLASSPTNLLVGQNIDIIGCTTTTLNGLQNVVSVYETSGTWYITTPTTTAGTGSESETATFSYSNFRSNGVLSPWNKPILGWEASTSYQVGDTIIDPNLNIEQVVAISSTGTSGPTVPTWATLFGVETTDNQVTWANYGSQGVSSSIPIHAYDKNGVDYSTGIYVLTGNAEITTGSPNVATVQVAQVYGGSISDGDTIVIDGATSVSLNGTWEVTAATLSTGIWTVQFQTTAAVFSSTPQTNGTLTDTLFDGNVVKIVFNTGLPDPSQGFVQAYLFQFLEREIIQVQVVGTNILSNSIMLQMATPEQIVSNPYMVLSTDTTITPYYPYASENSRFNVNRLGQSPVVSITP